jgi:hypothetical protein
MSTKKLGAPKPTTIVANDPKDHQGELRAIGGSQSDHWNLASPRRRPPPSSPKQPIVAPTCLLVRAWTLREVAAPLESESTASAESRRGVLAQPDSYSGDGLSHIFLRRAAARSSAP